MLSLLVSEHLVPQTVAIEVREQALDTTLEQGPLLLIDYSDSL